MRSCLRRDASAPRHRALCRLAVSAARSLARSSRRVRRFPHRRSPNADSLLRATPHPLRRAKRPKTITVTASEVAPKFIDYLTDTLKSCEKQCEGAGVAMK